MPDGDPVPGRPPRAESPQNRAAGPATANRRPGTGSTPFVEAPGSGSFGYDAAMSAFVVVDTHRFVKNLSRNGFTERQAEALAEEQVRLLTTQPATGADLAATRADIGALRAELRKWVIGALIAQAAVIVALVRLLL